VDFDTAWSDEGKDPGHPTFTRSIAMTTVFRSVQKFLAVLAAALCSAPALADSRIVFGLHFGVPAYWPAPHYYPPRPYYYYYPPAPFYAPPPVVQAPTPYAGYAPPPAEQVHAWYYCADSRAYYPYVRECPGGWERVPSTPSWR
jgi:hypothetical protein